LEKEELLEGAALLKKKKMGQPSKGGGGTWVIKREGGARGSMKTSGDKSLFKRIGRKTKNRGGTWDYKRGSEGKRRPKLLCSIWPALLQRGDPTCKRQQKKKVFRPIFGADTKKEKKNPPPEKRGDLHTSSSPRRVASGKNPT